MIILEGPDGSGKTTILRRLGHERRAFKALRAGVGGNEPGGSATSDFAGRDPAPIAYARQVLAAHPRVAFDRFHLSEVIYGPILRGAAGISDEEVILLERLLYARGIQTVICLPPFKTTMENILASGRERPRYQTLGFLRRAYLAWQDLAGKLRHDVTLDYTKQPEESSWERTLLEPRPRCPDGVVGSPAARFLVVGGRATNDLDLPFFTMDHFSGLLNRALWHAGFREEALAFANAELPDGRPRDIKPALFPSIECIIAIGLTAIESTSQLGLATGLPVLACPDPAHFPEAWGFKGYADVLRQAFQLVEER